MAITIGTVEAVARVKDNMTPKLAGLQQRISATGKHTAAVGKRMGQTWQTHGRQVGIAAGVASAAMLAMGNTWDNARKTIAQGTGATGDDLDALLASYRRLAGTVKGDVSGAVADLNTQFGATGPALETIVTHTLKAKAAFGEFDITSLGQAMKSFGVDAKGTGAFLDHAGTVAQATGHSMQALIGDMRMYGPIAKNAGLSSEETATFIGKMAEAGVSVSRVMPGLNAAMRNAAKEGVTDLRGHLNDAIVSVRQAATDTDALRVATETFGAEGAQRMVSAIRSGVLPSIDELSSAYTGVAGKTMEVYGETLTLMDQFGLFKDRMSALVGPAGNVIGVVGSLGAVLAGLGPFLPQIAAGARLMWAALTGPVGLAVTAIGLIGLALYKFRRQVGDVAAGVIRTWGSFVDLFLQGVEKLYGWIPGFSGKLMDARIAVANFVNTASNWADGLGEVTNATEAATDATGGLTGATEGLTGTTERATTNIGKYMLELQNLRNTLRNSTFAGRARAAEIEAQKGKQLELASVIQTKAIPALEAITRANSTYVGVVKSTSAPSSMMTSALGAAKGGLAGLAAGFSQAGGKVTGFIGEVASSFATGGPLGIAIAIGQKLVAGFVRTIGGLFNSASKVQKAWKMVGQAAQSAFEQARNAGMEAWQRIYEFAISTGQSTVHAAQLAADAQVAAIRRVMAAEGRKLVAIQAFESALTAIKKGKANEAAAYAERGAQRAMKAWGIATNAVIGAWQASGNAARDANEAMANSTRIAADEVIGVGEAGAAAVNAVADAVESRVSALQQLVADAQALVASIGGSYQMTGQGVMWIPPPGSMKTGTGESEQRLYDWYRSRPWWNDHIDHKFREENPGVTAQHGTGGIRDWGMSGTPAMLHGREAVVTQDQIERMIAAAASGSGSGGGDIILHLDGREVGRVAMDRIQQESRARGYR